VSSVFFFHHIVEKVALTPALSHREKKLLPSPKGRGVGGEGRYLGAIIDRTL
jgi:hypothetical protein